MRKGLIFGVMASMALLSGCAFHEQKATLRPVLEVVGSAEGAGRTIGLRVVDERSSTVLGHRGTATGAAAAINTDQDVAALIHEKVKEGLLKKGYQVVDFNGADGCRLSLELRELRYSTSQGFWTGGVEVEGAIKAVGTKSGDSYENMYRTDDKRRVVVVPTASKNEEWINSAVSDLLKQVFNDPGLSKFLSNG